MSEKKTDNYLLKELQQYSVHDFVAHWCFLISFPIGVVLGIITLLFIPNNISTVLSTFLPLSIQVTVTFAAITTAACIFINTMPLNDAFNALLYKADLIDAFILPSIIPLFTCCLNLVFSIITLTLLSVITNQVALSVILGASVFLCLYTVFGFINIYSFLRMYGKEHATYSLEKHP